MLLMMRELYEYYLKKINSFHFEIQNLRKELEQKNFEPYALLNYVKTLTTIYGVFTYFDYPLN